MKTIFEVKDIAPTTLKEHVDVSTRITFASFLPDQVSHFIDDLLAAANHFRDKGPLRIETDYDDIKQQLFVTLTGSLASAKLLAYKTENHDSLFSDEQETAITVKIVPFPHPRSVSINDHIIAASKNHPQNDIPLVLDTRYDEDTEQFTLIFKGSFFATTYLLFLVAIRLTQARN